MHRLVHRLNYVLELVSGLVSGFTIGFIGLAVVSGPLAVLSPELATLFNPLSENSFALLLAVLCGCLGAYSRYPAAISQLQSV